MNPAVHIALIGFTPAEREHIEAGLRPTGDRGLVYVVVEDLVASSVAIVNADHEASVTEIKHRGRLDSTVMLGATARPGAAAQLPRPPSRVTLLQALHRLTRAHPPLSASVRRVRDELARLVARPAAPQPAPPQIPVVQGRAAGLMPVVQVRAAGPAVPPRPRRTVRDHVLVVDEDAVVLRFMAISLQGLGFEVHLTRSGAEAIERVARHHFEWVFLATGMESADGFHVCRTLKRSAYPHRRAPPAVVLLLAEASAVHALRAEQAGADTCLVKPLRAEQLQGVVGVRGAQPPDEAQTTAASSSAWM